MKRFGRSRFPILTLLALSVLLLAASPSQQIVDSTPPLQPVKLIFVHHSTGENWLNDGYGDLGKTLAENNYFVSDTNYGWGPESIGDRTDIPNWIEWFASVNTPLYLAALFSENQQHASYTRNLPDPGGENSIILFKSCFPNSELHGDKDDPSGTYEDMTVAGAKYVYNTILQTFAAHPNKLFVVITAPPLTDGRYAQNARAFNQWLVQDWLIENNYTQANVAVFDFYNVLTHKDAHHQVNNGQIEYILGDQNTLAYPSGDDHPSIEGSLKATSEFVPLLNVFYHRWQEGVTGEPHNNVIPTMEPQINPVQSAMTSVLPAKIIDDFEGQPPAGTSGWEAFFADNAQTDISCTQDTSIAQAGNASLQYNFDVAADSWATCGIYYDHIQDWSAGEGISFHIRADKAGTPYHVDVYGGSPDARSTYSFHAVTPPGSDHAWIQVDIPWAGFQRVEWEENAGNSVDPTQVTGFSIGIETSPETRLSGTLWLDDLALLNGTQSLTQVEEPVTQPLVAENNSSGWPTLPCTGAVLFVVICLGMMHLFQQR